MRLYHPIGPGKCEMYSWCLVPKDASDEYKNAAYQAYTLTFAQAGTFEQDDLENWARLTRMAKSSAAKGIEFPYLMGMETERDEHFRGPGHVVKPYVNDSNFRNLWGRWADYLLGEA
jgi:3-phenylpropionate/trans-cinnamate dioxygenase alpha subunit